METIWNQVCDEFDLSQRHMVIEDLPYQRVDGSIFTQQGKRRCILQYKAIVNQGVNCILQKGIRTTIGAIPAAIKRPKYPHTHLRLEAAVQTVAYRALEAEGIHGAIPKVYDIFRYADEVRFSMEWIEGQSSYEYLYSQLGDPVQFEQTFFHILIQTAQILDILSSCLGLDHRDMKLDNLWVRKPPGGVVYTIEGVRYTCPFQVVLLDFGFACIGTSRRAMTVNLGNVIPDIDSCPKEGRDLYHILNRLLEPPQFSESLSPETRATLLGWFTPIGPSQPRRTHVLTSLPSFSLPALHPRLVLRWALSHIPGGA